MTRTLRLVVAWSVLWLAPAPGLAQGDSSRVLVDRIVAIVGDVPIPLTRLQEELSVYRQQGGAIPNDPRELEKLRREILDRVIDQELILQAARRDTSIIVTEEEVQAASEEGLRNIRGNFASELDYIRGLDSAGFASPDDYRLWYADQKRRELYNTKFINEKRARGDIRPIPVTEKEAREYYDQLGDQRPQRSPAVTFRQIVVPAEPDSARLAAAFRQADSLYRALQDDADFAVLARRFSADKGSGERGGDLGWFRRGRMVREFEDVAFSVRPGVVTRPVATPFGFHLIEVLRIEPASVQARHILIAPEITDSARAVARLRADSIKTKLMNGVGFDSLARRHHDRTEGARLIENVGRDRLPVEYRDALAVAQVGDIVGPFEFTGSGGRTKYAIVLLDAARPAGPATFDELSEQIRTSLSDQNAYARFIETLRRATYVEVRY